MMTPPPFLFSHTALKEQVLAKVRDEVKKLDEDK